MNDPKLIQEFFYTGSAVFAMFFCFGAAICFVKFLFRQIAKRLSS